MIHLRCQRECTLRKNRAMEIGGWEGDQNARAKQLCSSTPKKAETGRESNHFTTSKKNEHTRVLEVQAERQQPVSGYRCRQGQQEKGIGGSLGPQAGKRGVFLRFELVKLRKTSGNIRKNCIIYTSY